MLPTKPGLLELPTARVFFFAIFLGYENVRRLCSECITLEGRCFCCVLARCCTGACAAIDVPSLIWVSSLPAENARGTSSISCSLFCFQVPNESTHGEPCCGDNNAKSDDYFSEVAVDAMLVKCSLGCRVILDVPLWLGIVKKKGR